MPFRNLTMLPQEMELVRSVFKEVTAEPWFSRTASNEKEFAQFVLRAYRDGVADRDRLMTYSREAAALRFRQTV